MIGCRNTNEFPVACIPSWNRVPCLNFTLKLARKLKSNNSMVNHKNVINKKFSRDFWNVSEHLKELSTMIGGITFVQHGRTPLVHGAFTSMAQMLLREMSLRQVTWLAVMVLSFSAKIKTATVVNLSRFKVFPARCMEWTCGMKSSWERKFCACSEVVPLEKAII